MCSSENATLKIRAKTKKAPCLGLIGRLSTITSFELYLSNLSRSRLSPNFNQRLGIVPGEIKNFPASAIGESKEAEKVFLFCMSGNWFRVGLCKNRPSLSEKRSQK
jgi:hypothetical protein